LPLNTRFLAQACAITFQSQSTSGAYSKLKRYERKQTIYLQQVTQSEDRLTLRKPCTVLLDKQVYYTAFKVTSWERPLGDKEEYPRVRRDAVWFAKILSA
jgi:hypothetical protein